MRLLNTLTHSLTHSHYVWLHVCANNVPDLCCCRRLRLPGRQNTPNLFSTGGRGRGQKFGKTHDAWEPQLVSSRLGDNSSPDPLRWHCLKAVRHAPIFRPANRCVMPVRHAGSVAGGRKKTRTASRTKHLCVCKYNVGEWVWLNLPALF